MMISRSVIINEESTHSVARRILAEGGYEAESSLIYYGFYGPFRPEVEEIIHQQMTELVSSLGKAYIEGLQGGDLAHHEPDLDDHQQLDRDPFRGQFGGVQRASERPQGQCREREAHQQGHRLSDHGAATAHLGGSSPVVLVVVYLRG